MNDDNDNNSDHNNNNNNYNNNINNNDDVNFNNSNNKDIRKPLYIHPPMRITLPTVENWRMQRDETTEEEWYDTYVLIYIHICMHVYLYILVKHMY
jgi:hypothetical protein